MQEVHIDIILLVWLNLWEDLGNTDFCEVTCFIYVSYDAILSIALQKQMKSSCFWKTKEKKNLFSEGCVLQMAKTTLRGSLKYEELHESVEFFGGQYWYKLF